MVLALAVALTGWGVAVPQTLNGDVLAFTRDGGRTWREVAFGWKP